MSLDPPRKENRHVGALSDGSALGAVPLGDGRCRFHVWAPWAETVHVHLMPPRERLSILAPAADGYHGGVIEDVDPGALYLYRLDARMERPDPASRFQPRGVHGPSQVMDAGFDWTDGAWRGIPLRRYIFYELHVGTLSKTPSTGSLSFILMPCVWMRCTPYGTSRLGRSWKNSPRRFT